MEIFKGLSPEPVWGYFEEICKIPRPSKKEDKIIEYLLRFADSHQLQAKKDQIGNVLITKPASTGMDELDTIVLQCHLDMVCEKNADITHCFDTDPIQPVVAGDWVLASGTTLGADDGIGIAAALAVLADTKIKHGPIECLFTVDEETGLTGAFNLQPDFLSGDKLINLDSEDEGQIFIGCAGGKDTVARFIFEERDLPSKSAAYKISIQGLKGGHSGDDINKGRANSNKILARFLLRATEKFDIRLADFNGGNLRNAIPREAAAVVLVKKDVEISFLREFKSFEADLKRELAVNEPDLDLTIEKNPAPSCVVNRGTQKALLRSLNSCPNGVLAMSTRMPGMVETSSNLASVKFKDNYLIEVVTSQRSELESAKDYATEMVSSVFELAGAVVSHSDGYPGWAPNPNSVLLQNTVEAYQKLFGTQPDVKSIHAGLECGLFLEKYPNLDMVSFGPTIKDAHSPVEKLHIGSVSRFYKLLLELISVN